MKQIAKFNHEMFGTIRTMVDEKGETFFVGIDVATALGYSKPRNSVAEHVSPEDKTTALIQGAGSNYKSKAVLINESGLYALIFGSKLPSAKAFKKWVTSEVLPQIRKTGGYNGLDGRKKYRSYMVWTRQGLDFMKKLFFAADGRARD